MKIEVTSKIIVEVDLRATPYADWPPIAKTLARVAIERELRKGQQDWLLRERVIAAVERMVEQDPFEL